MFEARKNANHTGAITNRVKNIEFVKFHDSLCLNFWMNEINT